jgi:uncharacterized heparinase superfamily protein
MTVSVPTLLRRAARIWHTARHVPARQLARRVELEARYRLMDLLADGRMAAAPPVPAGRTPQPPLPPRPGLMREVPDGLVLCLPWGERTLTRPIPWYPAAGGGDTSQRADFNNIQFMEYLESADNELFLSLIEEWIAANPRRARGAWRYAWRPYNLSLRVSVWLEELARRGDRLAPDAVSRAHASAAEQLRFLERHLETDLRGNHLIKNIRALIWGGACLAGTEAARWTALGRRLLRRELAEQILPDGCHYERSPAYHCQVMGDLLACRAALETPLPELEDALARMAKALCQLTHPDGWVAPLNDGGLSMAPAPEQLQQVYAAGGGVAPGIVDGPFGLPDGGYFGLRADGELLIFDCGPLGPSYLPGHGHCDLLSFEWSTGGRRIVVDQGTHQYLAGPRRLASRSTCNHNTVIVDEAEQSEIYGAFRCGRRANPELRTFEARGASLRLVGSHDGYAHLAGQPRHVRTIEACPGMIEIQDRLEGRGDHTATAHLLLHPDCRVELRGDAATIRNGPVTVELAASAPLIAVAAEWYPDIYVRAPTARLELAVPAGGETLSVRLTARHASASQGAPS